MTIEELAKQWAERAVFNLLIREAQKEAAVLGFIEGFNAASIDPVVEAPAEYVSTYRPTF